MDNRGLVAGSAPQRQLGRELPISVGLADRRKRCQRQCPRTSPWTQIDLRLVLQAAWRRQSLTAFQQAWFRRQRAVLAPICGTTRCGLLNQSGGSLCRRGPPARTLDLSKRRERPLNKSDKSRIAHPYRTDYRRLQLRSSIHGACRNEPRRRSRKSGSHRPCRHRPAARTLLACDRPLPATPNGNRNDDRANAVPRRPEGHK